MKVNKTNTLTFFYELSMLMVFLDSIFFYYTWSIPNFFFPLCSVIICIPLCIENKILDFDNKYIYIIFSLSLLYGYTCYRNSGAGQITYVCSFFCIGLFLIQNQNLKKETFDLITKILAILLLLSLLQWSMVNLLHIKLPYKNVLFGDIYSFHNYGLFLFTYNELNLSFNRFHSLFLEPGQLGVVLVLILAVEDFDLRKWQNIIILIACFFTLSLATYIMLAVAVVYKNLSFKNFIYIFIVILIVYILYRVTSSKSDSIFYKLIFSRLIVKNGKMTGNNRFSIKLSNYYSTFIKTNALYLGIGSVKYKNMNFGSNAGYKVYVLTYGLIGFLLTLNVYFSAFLKKINKKNFLLFLLWFLGFLQAAYPLWNADLMIILVGNEFFENERNLLNRK